LHPKGKKSRHMTADNAAYFFAQRNASNNIYCIIRGGETPKLNE
jgi:hypothetical protein